MAICTKDLKRKKGNFWWAPVQKHGEMLYTGDWLLPNTKWFNFVFKMAPSELSLLDHHYDIIFFMAEYHQPYKGKTSLEKIRLLSWSSFFGRKKLCFARMTENKISMMIMMVEMIIMMILMVILMIIMTKTTKNTQLLWSLSNKLPF